MKSSGQPAPQHMVALDGLRGLAAILVMIHHMSFWTQTELFGHAILAVDFFFVLSGFVIAQAYEDRLRVSMSFGRFLVLRIIRLYPMIVLATVLAVIAAMLSTRPGSVVLTSVDIAQAGAFALFGLPSPPWISGDTFPLNPPEWSLFFEIAANAFYAKFIFKFGNRTFIIFLSAILILYIYFGRQHGLNVGFVWWSFWLGFLRVALPYLIGVGIHRLRARGLLPRFELPLPLLALILAGILFVPYLGRADRLFWLLAVAVLFPVVVFAATCSRSHEKGLTKISADISYPLYLIHYPLLVLLVPMLTGAGLDMKAAMWVCGSVIIMASWLVYRWYDRPVRKLISRSIGLSRPPGSAG